MREAVETILCCRESESEVFIQLSEFSKLAYTNIEKIKDKDKISENEKRNSQIFQTFIEQSIKFSVSVKQTNSSIYMISFVHTF